MADTAAMRRQLAALDAEIADFTRPTITGSREPSGRPALRRLQQRRAALVNQITAATPKQWMKQPSGPARFLRLDDPSLAAPGPFNPALQGLRSQDFPETRAEIAGMGPITPLVAQKPPDPAPGAAPGEIGPPGAATPAQQVDERTGAPPAAAPTAEDYRKADLTPELAALRAAIDSPQPVFQKSAFTKTEQAMMGFLAGLRGIDKVLPIIEQRRRDAMVAYDAAREARAERIREATALVGLRQQERSFERQDRSDERQGRERAEDVDFRERQFTESGRRFGEAQQTARRGQDLAAQARRDALAAKGVKQAPTSAKIKVSLYDTLLQVGAEALPHAERGVGGPIEGLLPTVENQEQQGRYSQIVGTINRMLGGGASLTPNEEKYFQGVLFKLTSLRSKQVGNLRSLMRFVRMERANLININGGEEAFGLTGEGGVEITPGALPPGFTDTDSFELEYP